MRENSKKIIAIILIFISIGSFYFLYFTWQNNKGEILIKVSDFIAQISLPYKIFKLTAEPRDLNLAIPIKELDIKNIEDSWDSPRSGGRTHEGVDMFAKKGTPIYSATEGFILRTGHNNLGGNFVFTIGAGGVKYYYAHLDRVAMGMEIGTPVTLDTVIGFVGNTGNAASTPPHLHFGMYLRGAENPYPLLINRNN